MKTTRPTTLSRRTFLRGAVASLGGVALGLPLLESMLDSGGSALADGSPLPPRFALWFWGNGSDPARWVPNGTGGGWTPSEMLGGLADIKDYVNVISGTTLPTRWHLGHANRNNPHVEGAVAILSGGNPLIHPSFAGQSNDWDFLTVPAPSVDQLIAAHIAGPTPYRSITTRLTNVHSASAGTSSAPGTAISYISHSAPYTFNPPIADPSQLFAMLFSGGVGGGSIDPAPPGPSELMRTGALDAILEDASALRQRLGTTDRARLDAHMEGIYELQNRIAPTGGGAVGQACAVPVDPGMAASFRDRSKAFADLIAMAFACDLSRVATFQFSSPASHAFYPDVYAPGELVVNNEQTSFHEYEHTYGTNDTVRRGLKYFVDLFGDFCESLRAIPDGAGNLLDTACVLGTSELGEGTYHHFTEFPTLIAGRANGALAYPGVHVRTGGDLATRVPFTCMKALGLPQTSWGSEQFYVDRPVSEVLA